MPETKLTLVPGVTTQYTPTLAKGTFIDTLNVRFLSGLPQKLGGWVRLVDTPVTGTATGMHTWSSLGGNPYLAVGTEQMLEVYSDGILYDITPITHTDNVAVHFRTQSGIALARIRDPSNDANVGDWVDVVTPVSIGGIIVSGKYRVATVINGDTYEIVTADAATSTVFSGGAVATYTTTAPSPDVLVTLADHGLSVGDVWTERVSTAVGGLTINGSYVVGSVPSVNTFTITASTVATSSATVAVNGDNVRIAYLLPSGYASVVELSGYGVGLYGAGIYSAAPTSSYALSTIRQWIMDSWGEYLVANYTKGPVYYWVPPMSLDNRAVVVPNAPTVNIAIFVMMPAQILVACGTEQSGTFDPLLIRWCDVADFTVWTPSTTNQAGSFRIPSGSAIVGAMLVAQQGLVWTDTDVWSVIYRNVPFVLSFNKIGSNCGLIGARAMGSIGGTVVWMSFDNFFSYGADGVRPVECPVWDYVFRDLDTLQSDKIFAAVNSLFNEISFFFPSLTAEGSVDRCVTLDLDTGVWWVNLMQRTAWHEGGVFKHPLAVDQNSIIQKHESGSDADGEAMPYAWESGYFDLGEGTDFLSLDRMIPDFVMDGDDPALALYVKVRGFPNVAVHTYGPYPITETTPYVSLRARGRQASIRIQGNDLGSFTRLGAVRYRIAADGKR